MLIHRGRIVGLLGLVIRILTRISQYNRRDKAQRPKTCYVTNLSPQKCLDRKRKWLFLVEGVASPNAAAPSNPHHHCFIFTGSPQLLHRNTFTLSSFLWLRWRSGQVCFTVIFIVKTTVNIAICLPSYFNGVQSVFVNIHQSSWKYLTGK